MCGGPVIGQGLTVRMGGGPESRGVRGVKVTKGLVVGEWMKGSRWVIV